MSHELKEIIKCDICQVDADDVVGIGPGEEAGITLVQWNWGGKPLELDMCTTDLATVGALTFGDLLKVSRTPAKTTPPTKRRQPGSSLNSGINKVKVKTPIPPEPKPPMTQEKTKASTPRSVGDHSTSKSGWMQYRSDDGQFHCPHRTGKKDCGRHFPSPQGLAKHHSSTHVGCKTHPRVAKTLSAKKK